MVQVHVPQGVGVRVPPWAPDTKRRLREQPPFLLCLRAQRLRALSHLAQHLRPYLIYLAEPREADPGSSHRTSRMADESTDCPVDIQRNNPVG